MRYNIIGLWLRKISCIKKNILVSEVIYVYFNPLSFSSIFVSKLLFLLISAFYYDDNAEEKTNLYSIKIL